MSDVYYWRGKSIDDLTEKELREALRFQMEFIQETNERQMRKDKLIGSRRKHEPIDVPWPVIVILIVSVFVTLGAVLGMD